MPSGSSVFLSSNFKNDLFLKSIALRFGLITALVLVLLKLSEFSYLSNRISTEFYVAIIGLATLAAGLYVGFRFKKEKVVEVEVAPEPKSSEPNQAIIDQLNLSKRELEVLDGIARGLSNQEIAEQLFVSVNTIKTHANNLYVKLDVKRRTQAVTRARELGVLV